MREFVFLPEFLNDRSWWIRNDRKIALRIIKLIFEINKEPFDGVGKPEHLKYMKKNSGRAG